MLSTQSKPFACCKLSCTSNATGLTARTRASRTIRVYGQVGRTFCFCGSFADQWPSVFFFLCFVFIVLYVWPMFFFFLSEIFQYFSCFTFFFFLWLFLKYWLFLLVWSRSRHHRSLAQRTFLKWKYNSCYDFKTRVYCT